MTVTSQTNLINVTINGQAIAVPKGTTIYNAAKQLGIDIPIFCYQDRMPPFGACRMCLVEVEKMPKLQASCTFEVTEGMVVHTESDFAIAGRKGIIEFLLINHPLDCPICDRGGECPLQDNTLNHGPGESRFYENKRKFIKPLPLGPVLMLDRERCITCARCTRFGDLIAGDHALEFIQRGFRTEVGTPDGGPAESKFIGNTIMICPVGALTSQVYRFRARPWDNDPTSTTCTLCPVGCSMILDARDGDIMRTRSCENKEVNDIWLCDKGWFGYEFSEAVDRLDKPLLRRFGKLEPVTWEEALSFVAVKFQESKIRGRMAGFGGNVLTVEESYLFQQLFRNGAGVNHLDYRIGMPIHSLSNEGLSPGMRQPLKTVEDLSFALLLGFDITEEFPVIWLRLRQAINKGAKVIYIGHYAPEVSKHLTQTIVHAPGDEKSWIPKQLEQLIPLVEKGGSGAIFVGSQYLNSPCRKEILSNLSKLNSPQISIHIMEGRENSMGARYAGMHPELAYNYQTLNQPGYNALEVLQAAAKEGWEFLYVAGANPAVKFPAELWKAAKSKLGFLVVQDLFLTKTAQEADVVLPTLAFVEKEGTFINIEGRVQRMHPGKHIPEGLHSDEAIFNQLAGKIGISLKPMTLLNPGERILKFQDNNSSGALEEKIVPLRDGELAATFAYALFDHGVRMTHNTKLVQMAKKPYVRIHPNEAVKRGIQDGMNVQLKNENSSIEAKIMLDRNISEGTILLPLGFEELPVQNLATQLYNGLPVQLNLIE